MGRPPLAPGAHGHITFYKDQGSGRVRARARCRDYDGRYLAVTRWGGDQTEAGARLLGALDGHTAFPLGVWAAGARLREVVPLWQADIDATDLAPSTRQPYRAATSPSPARTIRSAH